MRWNDETKQALFLGVEGVLWILCAILMGYFFTVRDCLLDNIFLILWIVIAVGALAVLVRAELRFFRSRRQRGAGK